MHQAMFIAKPTIASNLKAENKLPAESAEPELGLELELELELAAVELLELWFLCIIVSIIHSCLKEREKEALEHKGIAPDGICFCQGISHAYRPRCTHKLAV